MPTLQTWAGRSRFRYSGSVIQGTTIQYGRGYSFSISVSGPQYTGLLNHFHGQTVNIGTSRTDPPPGSVGEWLQAHVTKTGIASYDRGQYSQIDLQHAGIVISSSYMIG